MVSDAAKKKAAAKKAATQKKFSKVKNPKDDSGDLSSSIDCEETIIPDNGNPIFSSILFPPSVSSKQRAFIHEIAEKNNLTHISTGEESSRQIEVSIPGKEGNAFVISSENELSSAEITSLISKILQINLEEVTKENPNTKRGENLTKLKTGLGNFGKDFTRCTLDEFITKMGPLINLEKEAEMAISSETMKFLKPEIAQKKGYSLLNLRCTATESGLLGKTLLEFKPNRSDLLPPHRFSPHDVVALRPQKGDPSREGGDEMAQGVVYRLKDSAIIIAFEDVPDGGDGLDVPLRLDRLANDVTYKRLKDTLADLSRPSSHGPAARLIPILFGETPPSPPPRETPKFPPFNRALDPSQISAVSRCLACPEVLLIHGPPGTGKTTALVEVILQEVSRGSRVLVCSGSNVAVDNLVERLWRWGENRGKGGGKFPLVRLGHPARLLPSVLNCSLDALVLKSDSSSLAEDVRKEMRSLHGQLTKCKGRGERNQVQREIRRLAKEEKQRQRGAVEEVIKGAKVVLCTLTGVIPKQLKGTPFDLVVIDEAAQALEIACWNALLLAPRCVLAGDHLQLPPTVQSEEAEKNGLGITLFERLAGLLGEKSIALLTVQYRMHSAIMKWSSEELYEGKLTAHGSVAGHTLKDLEGFHMASTSGNFDYPLLLVDTTGCDMEEVKEEEGGSLMNPGEAEVAISHVKQLLSAGLKAEDVGIITPYRAQVGLMKEKRSKEKELQGVEISTVDGFQGREKEAIVISMVRSNGNREVGFLADSRRMNVAVTRARRHCCVICDTETVSNDRFLKRMVNYFEENGELVSAMEFT